MIAVSSNAAKLESTSHSDSGHQLNIYVEGNTGAGKSTLLNYFSQFEEFETVHEPVSKWQNFSGHNMLHLMYDNPKENAFKFQLYSLLTLIQDYLEPQKKQFRIMERSIPSQSCFVQTLVQQNVIDDVSRAIVEAWTNFLVDKFNIKSDVIIYIKTTPQKLLERIQTRGRKEEENTIDIDYLQKLHDAYENYLLSNVNAKICTINGDLSREDVVNEYRKCYDFIKSVRKG